MAVIGKIIAMTGVANIINEKGESRTVVPGEQLQTGDTLQTPPGVTVKVQLENGRVIDVAAGQMISFTEELTNVIVPEETDSAVDLATIDSVINAIESGQDLDEVLEATAAGAAGGSEGGHSAVFLDRINLFLNSLSLNAANDAANDVSVNPTNGFLNPLLAEQFVATPVTPVTPGVVTVTSVTSGIDDPNNSGNTIGDQVVEGDVNDPLLFGVTLSEAPAAGGETVTLTFTSGTATFGVDTASVVSIDFGDGNGFVEFTGTGGTFDVLVPEGTQTFVVSLATTDDTELEDLEQLTLAAQTANNTDVPSAVGGIIDNDTPVSVISVTPGIDDPDNPGQRLGDTVVEGDESLQFTVGLNNPTAEVTPVTLSIADVEATFGVDTTTSITVVFDDGTNTTVNVTPGDSGTTTLSVDVPVGVQNFVVVIPTVDDTVVEDQETLTLTAFTDQNVTDGSTPPAATGTIVDNDTPIVVTNVTSGIDDPNNPGSTIGDQVIEGDATDPLLFQVDLNSAVPVGGETVTLTFADITASFGADTASAINIDFGDGNGFVEFTGTGSTFDVLVPAGTQSFVVSLATTEDTAVEDLEQLTLTASTTNNTGDLPSATGGIIDNDGVVYVETVQAGTGTFDPSIPGGVNGSIVLEGDVNDPLLFEVGLNAATPLAGAEVTLTFTDSTAVFGTDTTTDILVDFGDGNGFVPVTVTPAQDSGVTTYVIDVPANVQSFVVSVPTTDDALIEDAERVLFTASTELNGVDGNPVAPSNVAGTILDDDTPVFVETVQAGTGTFDPSIPGGVDGSVVLEGDVDDPLLFEVGLNTIAPTGGAEVTLTFTDDTAIFGTDTSTDILIDFGDGNGFVAVTATPTQSGGVTFYVVEVPAGIKDFVVNVPTTDDGLLETAEGILFTASTADNDATNPVPDQVTGTIIDNTPVFVETVQAGTGTFDPSIPGGIDGSVVLEGDVDDPLLFEVGLNTIAPTGGAEVTLTFTDDTAIFGTDTSTDILIDFGDGNGFVAVTATPTQSGGVTSYVVEVPAGIKDFVVNVPTTDDDLIETPEGILFTASAEGNDATNPAPDAVTGTIIDNDTDVYVETVEAGVQPVNQPSAAIVGATVDEGDPLLFAVNLNTIAPTGGVIVSLTFTDDTAIFGTDTSTDILIDFGDGNGFVPVTVSPTQVSGETVYNVTVPAGIKDFVVNVPTLVDSETELSEMLKFTASTTANDTDHPVPTPVEGRILDFDLPEATGLNGEYYGYNDLAAFGAIDGADRVHADDEFATAGPIGNLDSIADIEAIINGRNGSAVVGSSDQSGEDVPDVRFFATSVRYGLSGNVNDAANVTVNNNLGNNVVQTAGEALSGSSALATFLATDAVTAVVKEGSAVASAPAGAATSGIGNTTDSIVRLTGSVFLDRGNYDFRVFADDGFRLKLGGETLIEFDGNQSPTEHEFTNLFIENGQAGLTPIELIYWEQGQNGVLHMEFKLSSEPDSAYRTFSSENLPMYPEVVPIALADNQTIVNTGTADNPDWEVQSGNSISGEGPITGTSIADILTGSASDDTIQGLAGTDNLSGLAGEDVLAGGEGNDLLDGGTGADTMTGGLGDDRYVVDDAGDITVEAADEGTDTIDLDFAPGSYTLADNFENLNVLTSDAVNVTGNALNNRIETGAGDDTIDGAAGDDHILGGAGNDMLTGGAGSDVFEWNLADKGAVGTPAIDHITDFVYTGDGKVAPNVNNPGAVERTDAIDLRDLLQGEVSTLTDANFEHLIDIGNLLDYLDIDVSGGSTTINISSSGDIASGADQQIVLDNVDLFTATGVSAGDQTSLLQNLLANGTLIVD